MTSSEDVHRCDYPRLHSHPPVFTSERAELHNLLSPIRVLPVEVLSYVFQQLIDPDYDGRPYFRYYQRRLAQALILTSVSSYFRSIALDTPMLWNSVSFYIPDNKAIGRVLSLLQHCTALAPCINVSVSENAFEEPRLDEEQVRSAVEILLTPHITRKVRDFDLSAWRNTSIWVAKLKGPSFPMLDALSISTHETNSLYDFGSLKTLTRLHLHDRYLEQPIVVPPSVQHLDVGYITPQVFLSLAHQCPDLVNCKVNIDTELEPLFTGVVTLNNLKRLAFDVIGDTETRMLAERMRLPSLETLEVLQDSGDTFIGVLPLCRNVSATLTTLIFNTSCSNTLDPDGLYQVCMLSLPKLTEFEMRSDHYGPFVNAIQALGLVDGECSKSETHHLPALKSILLRCYDNEIRPYSLPDLLKKWRIGEALNFQLELTSDEFKDCRQWPPKLRRELKSIVGHRRVKITWGNCEVYHLCF